MPDHVYYVYIVASRSRTLYTGITSQIEIRIQQHREGKYGGFTGRYKCNRLVYYERWQDVHRAIARETEIKSWTRAKRIALIESLNPTWEDLSADWGKRIKLYGEV